jgi:calcium-dependent protein kinase
MPDEKVDGILAQIDTDCNGYIDYSEFIAATIDLRKALTHANLEAAFRAFDHDRNGTISSDEIRRMLGNV